MKALGIASLSVSQLRHSKLLVQLMYMRDLLEVTERITHKLVWAEILSHFDDLWLDPLLQPE